MTYQQLVEPDPNIPCRAGMCLEYVRETFGAPIVEPTATAGWENAKYKHLDYDFPDGVCVPLWFAIPGIPAGHVVLRMSDGSIYSTSDDATVPHHHPSLNDLVWYYGARVEPQYQLQLQYLGWTEDISGVRVVQDFAIQTDSITPTQEDDVTLTPEQATQLAYIASPQFKVDLFTGTSDVERAARKAYALELLGTEIPWHGFDGNIPASGRTTTTPAVALGYADAIAGGLANAVNAVPSAVLNHQFTLPDGTVTNLAGILTAIHATPVAAGTAGTPAAPSIVSGSILDALNKAKITN